MSRYTDYLAGALISDIALAVGSYNYYGYCRPDGAWIIMRESVAETEYRYALGHSDYSTGWTNKATIGYVLGNALPQL